MGIATAQITGNLTSDPRTNDAQTVANLRVAVNTRRKDGDEWVDHANYFDVVVIGRRAETVSRYLQKGRKVAVAGQLRWREWVTKDDEKRQGVEIVADEIEFLSGPRDDDGGEDNHATVEQGAGPGW